MAIRRSLKVDVSVQAAFPASYPRLLASTASKAYALLPKGKLALPQSARVAIHIISPAAMKSLNKQYRKKNRPTDVLAFSAFEAGMPLELAHYIGEIFICWQVAEKQAPDYFCTPRQELQRLTVHGLLHLFGYDHEKSRSEAKIMFALQEKLLQRLR